eukprot:2017025-Alexandrium_andersonii.AAC.1
MGGSVRRTCGLGRSMALAGRLRSSKILVATERGLRCTRAIAPLRGGVTGLLAPAMTQCVGDL